MSRKIDFTFVTCSELVYGDPDDLLAFSILQAEGYNCAVADWRDNTFDFGASRVTVIRSTWDYHLHLQDFRQWLDRVSATSVLLNDAALVKNNLDKKYLLDLDLSGITICPTVYIGQDDQVDGARLQELLNNLSLGPDQRIIIKPAVGLSTYGVKKFDTTKDGFQTEALQHINSLKSDRAVLIQPYLALVETYGERSLIYIDGVFSHSIRKSAFQKLAVAGQAGEESKTATELEIAFGYKVLATLAQTPLYARVDIVGDGAALISLLELELTEPSLYLSMAEGSANRLADALVKRLTKA